MSLGGASLVAASSSVFAAAIDERGPLTGLDEYCRKALADWHVPGMAIAVVKETEVIFARGFGVRELGREDVVDENTIFPIASCTKSFTAAVIAKLVDQGKLHWDDPINRHVPELELPSPHDRQVTIRHALQHRSGYPTANMLWRSGAFDADAILRRVRLLKPVAAPGEKVVYNNVMYLAAGRAAERASGESWGELLTTMYLRPMSMTSTAPDSSHLRSLANTAKPHLTIKARIAAIERYCPDVVAPAGAIHSSVSDMAKWLIMHLNRGTYKNQILLTDARITEMHTPVPQAPLKQAVKSVPKAPLSRYGLGWFVNEHAGEAVVEHSGTKNGFVAWMAMIPAKSLGLIILSNHHQTGLNYALRSWVFDRLLGRPEMDWSASVQKDYTQGWQRLLREAKDEYDSKRPADAAPGRTIRDYAGKYESRIYGEITVTEDKQRLKVAFGARFRGEMQPWGKDMFRVFFSNPGLDDWLVTFSTQSGRVNSMHVQESPWAPEWYDDRDDLGIFIRQQPQVNLSPVTWGADELEKFNKLNAQFGNQNVLAVSDEAVITGTTCAPAIRAGLEALKQGGSAADAVLTTSLTQIALSKGAWVSCAGILTMVYYDASSGRVYNLNAGYNTVLAEDDPLTIPEKASGRTALVPGYMAGVEAAHKRFGKLPFAALFEPAIYYADKGFRLNSLDAWQIGNRRSVLSRLAETKQIFLKSSGESYKHNDLFRQPELARTLREVAHRGANYMYRGEWARKFVAVVQKEGGKLTQEDLSDYQVLWSDPIKIPHRGYDVFAHGIPALGGVNVAEALHVAAAADLTGMGDYVESPQAFFWLSQINNLYALSYLDPEERARILGVKDASLESRTTADHGKHTWDLIRNGKLAHFHTPKTNVPMHSDAVVAIDRWGNIAALCHTVNTTNWGLTGIFIDGVSIPDSGAIQQKLIQRTGPGKRLPDTTSPLIVMHDGKPVAALSSIGTGLHQATMAALFKLLNSRQRIKPAIDAPAMHLPKFESETGFRPQVIDGDFSVKLLEDVGKLGLEVLTIPQTQKFPAPRGYVVGASIDSATGRREAVATSMLNARALGK